MNDKTPEELTADMLKQELYIVETRPARSPEIKKLLPDHLDYQINLERQGILHGAGPFYEEDEDIPSGGFIVIRANNFADARKIADGDPLHKGGHRSYTIRKWLLNEGSLTMTIRYSDQSISID